MPEPNAIRSPSRAARRSRVTSSTKELRYRTGNWTDTRDDYHLMNCSRFQEILPVGTGLVAVCFGLAGLAAAWFMGIDERGAERELRLAA